MAIQKLINCRECKKQVPTWCKAGDYPSVCESCKTTIAATAKATFLAALANRPLDERLAAIEEWMYDHGLVRHGYIPEPRY